MTSLRIAIGIAALLLLAAAAVGAAMSVQINWAFATTLSADPVTSTRLALLFAAIETSRILMPFAVKGLEVLKWSAKGPRVAFWVFTAISVGSAAGYFAGNRA